MSTQMNIVLLVVLAATFVFSVFAERMKLALACIVLGFFLFLPLIGRFIP